MHKLPFRCFITALGVLVYTTLFTAICYTNSQTIQEAQYLKEEMTLREFLHTLDDSKTTRYISAFSDLNSDGRPEAIVYLIGDHWCGSGGCNTLILTPQDNYWKIIANITITRPPIIRLSSRSHGWYSIGVWVEGGGIHPGYQAELRFDGKTYPRNPSAPPARRLEERQAGEVLIGSLKDAVPLYELTY